LAAVNLVLELTEHALEAVGCGTAAWVFGDFAFADLHRRVAALALAFVRHRWGPTILQTTPPREGRPADRRRVGL
jgi:hypothetical protein